MFAHWHILVLRNIWHISFLYTFIPKNIEWDVNGHNHLHSCMQFDYEEKHLWDPIVYSLMTLIFDMCIPEC